MSGTVLLVTWDGAGDQPAVAERAKELGLAHVCQPDASTDEIAAAVTAALGDSAMAAASRAFSERVEQHPGIEEAVERIEGLMLATP